MPQAMLSTFDAYLGLKSSGPSKFGSAGALRPASDLRNPNICYIPFCLNLLVTLGLGRVAHGILVALPTSDGP